MASFTEKIDGSYTLQTLNAADTITISGATANTAVVTIDRSEEHTSELQSH